MLHWVPSIVFLFVSGGFEPIPLKPLPINPTFNEFKTTKQSFFQIVLFQRQFIPLMLNSDWLYVESTNSFCSKLKSRGTRLILLRVIGHRPATPQTLPPGPPGQAEKFMLVQLFFCSPSFLSQAVLIWGLPPHIVTQNHKCVLNVANLNFFVHQAHVRNVRNWYNTLATNCLKKCLDKTPLLNLSSPPYKDPPCICLNWRSFISSDSCLVVNGAKPNLLQGVFLLRPLKVDAISV